MFNKINSAQLQNLLFALTLSLGSVSSVFAATYNANPVNYRSLLNNLDAGDTLVLAAGTYNSGLPIIDLHGTTGQPVTIIGPANGAPAIFTPRSCCNTVQIKNSSYVEIRHLTVDGQNINGEYLEVDAVNSRGITHHITIANLHIINHGVSQSTIGISTKGPAWNWIIRDNIIDAAGTGMYLGNSDGYLAFVNGLIERNLIVNTIGYNLQIKHQNSRPTGIGMPQTDSRTIIRHNVFSKGNNASGGGMARPNLLVGHFPLNGATGSNDLYEIYGNFFYQNPSEALFQGEGNIAFYNNLLVNDAGDALNVQPHNDVPKRIHIFRNTVVAQGSGISVTGGDSAYPQKIFANVVFAGRPLRATDETDNVTDNYNAAVTYLTAPTAALGVLNLFPKNGKTTGPTMNMVLVKGFTDSNLDFDGQLLRNTDRGAYVDDDGGAGWLPQLQIKPSSDSTKVIPLAPTGLSLKLSM